MENAGKADKEKMDCSQTGLEEYKFDHKYRGLALIFVHEKFQKSSLDPRAGALVDARKMKHLFKNLDFKVKVYKDLTRELILEKLQKAADSKNNKDSDCFACVFSTHGEEAEERDRKQGFSTWKNSIYGYDATPIFVDQILSIFSNEGCPYLADKPKLFFIQACRSRHAQPQHHYDYGSLLTLIRQQSRESGQGDSRNQDSSDKITERQQSRGNGEAEQDSKGDSARQSLSRLALGKYGMVHQDEVDDIQEIREVVDIYKDWSEDQDDDELCDIPESFQPAEDEADSGGDADSGNIPEPPVEVAPIMCPNDCLVVYPVMPGRVAFKNASVGSWMLHYMYENFSFMLRDFRLLPYLTKVCRDMANHEFRPRPLNEDISNPANYIVTKATAHVVHRLSRDVRLFPKHSNTLMALWNQNLYPKLHGQRPL